MRMSIALGLGVAVVLTTIAGGVQGAEWGDLTGQILFDGPAPEPEEAKITSDRDFCCRHDVINEALLVDPETKGVKNVIIFLNQSRRDRREVPIHDSYMALKDEPVKMDNNACRFAPHVSLIWTERKLVIGNSDPIGHNVNMRALDGEGFNETIPSGGIIEKEFTSGKRLPVGVSCSIHPWMKGWAVIRETPYMAVTDKNGRFEIKNLPVGKWQFRFWQEMAGYVSEVSRNGESERWRRGTIEVEIKPGTNDMGEIVVSPEVFFE